MVQQPGKSQPDGANRQTLCLRRSTWLWSGAYYLGTLQKGGKKRHQAAMVMGAIAVHCNRLSTNALNGWGLESKRASGMPPNSF